MPEAEATSQEGPKLARPMKVARTVWRGLCLREGTRLPYLNFAKLWSK